MRSRASSLNVNCPFCATPSSWLVPHRDDCSARIHLWRSSSPWFFCLRCGAAFPDRPEEVERNAGQWQNSRLENLDDPLARRRHQLRFDVSELWGQRMLSFFSEHTSVKDGSLLDLGCGPGGALHAFKKSGWQTKGVDVDLGLEIHHVEYGLEVVYGTIEAALDKAQEMYDLIVCSHVLYFVQRPNDFFKRLPSLLVPKGYVLLVISDLLSCRSNSVPSTGHSWYPTLRSVKKLLINEGFWIVKTKYLRGSFFVLARNDCRLFNRQLLGTPAYFSYLRLISQPLRSSICRPAIRLARQVLRR